MTTVRVKAFMLKKINMTGTSFVLELVPLRGEDKFGVPFKSSVDHPRHLYMGVSPRGKPPTPRGKPPLSLHATETGLLR